MTDAGVSEAIAVFGRAGGHEPVVSGESGEPHGKAISKFDFENNVPR
jgi:hypothetical protein